MRALKIIALVIGGLIVITLILGAIAPKSISTEQSTVIDATPQQVFDIVNDFRTWEAWSSWQEQDPSIDITMGDQTVGTGASYSWTSDDGNGKMSILESHPHEKIDMELAFDGMGSADVGWQFQPEQQGTKVVWDFYSDMPFPFNAMLLFQDMEGRLAKDYQRGLELLKTYVEAHTAEPAAAVQLVPMPYQHFVGIREHKSMGEISEFFDKHFPALFQAIQIRNIPAAGSKSGLFYTWDEATKTSDMAAAIPVNNQPDPCKDFQYIPVDARQALLYEYYGPNAGSGVAHEAIEAYLKANQLNAMPPAIEEYVTDPAAEPDTAKWLTRVYYPLAY